jgi:hypothetical protein
MRSSRCNVELPGGKEMKRTFTLILLSIIALALAGCGMISTGEEAAEQAGEIADFTVPDGFSPGFSMNLAGSTMVGYDHSDGRSHIFLMQAPDSAGITAEELEQQMRDAIASSQGQSPTEVVESEEVALTILGQDVTGVMGRGTSSEDNADYRVLTVPFAGKGGPAILIIERPEASWDQAEVDTFIASFQ